MASYQDIQKYPRLFQQQQPSMSAQLGSTGMPQQEDKPSLLSWFPGAQQKQNKNVDNLRNLPIIAAAMQANQTQQRQVAPGQVGKTATAATGGAQEASSRNYPTGDTQQTRDALKAGFLKAGRQDLANMVDTPEFAKWINQESGWNVGVTSAANNQGLPNYGLFQFWAGHDWASANMSPEDQAYMAATKFNLTPDRIKQFASQIDSGTYEGWG